MEIPQEEREEELNYYLELFSIKDAVGDLIASYSHGMKQKIVLTGALLSNQIYLFLMNLW